MINKLQLLALYASFQTYTCFSPHFYSNQNIHPYKKTKNKNHSMFLNTADNLFPRVEPVLLLPCFSSMALFTLGFKMRLEIGSQVDCGDTSLLNPVFRLCSDFVTAQVRSKGIVHSYYNFCHQTSTKYTRVGYEDKCVPLSPRQAVWTNTSGMHLGGCLHLYPALSTCDPITQDVF